MSTNYLSQLAATPPVSPTEEQRLLQRVAQGQAAARLIAAGNDDAGLQRRVRAGNAARDTLVQANGRLVISVATRYRNLGLTMEELCQEGVLGLMKAIDKWKPDKGATKLSTYATWWIRQAVSRAVRDQGRTIRLPVYQTDRLYRLRKAAENLGKDGATPTVEEIAVAAGEPVEAVTELFQRAQPPISLDAPIDDDDDALLGDFVAAPEDAAQSAETVLLAKIIEQALGDLTAREEAILRMRFGITGCSPHHQTLVQIAVRYGLTRERIRQIEVEALEKLRVNPKIRRLAGFLDS
jgi:RNA polymerase primary sigma factor